MIGHHQLREALIREQEAESLVKHGHGRKGSSRKGKSGRTLDVRTPRDMLAAELHRRRYKTIKYHPSRVGYGIAWILALAGTTLIAAIVLVIAGVIFAATMSPVHAAIAAIGVAFLLTFDLYRMARRRMKLVKKESSK